MPFMTEKMTSMAAVATARLNSETPLMMLTSLDFRETK